MSNVSAKRVFVGIKTSDSIAEACVAMQCELAGLPAKFIPPRDIHITLLSPWQMPNRDQAAIEDKLRRTLAACKRFTLQFERFAYGPSNRERRLVWLEGRPSADITALKEKLLAAFDMTDRVPFLPHATIMRFPRRTTEQLLPRTLRKPVALSMLVKSVQFFESPHEGGAGYKVLASFPLSA